MKRLIPLLLVATLCPVAGEPPKDPKKAPPKDRLFSGVVVAGNVLQPEAELAPAGTWVFDAGSVVAKEPIQTDAKGHFEKTMPWKGGIWFFAVDKARKLGALVEVKEADLAKPVTVKLAPLVKVKVRVTCRDESFPPDGVAVEVKREGPGRVASAMVESGSVTLLLPPGDWKLRFHKEDFQARELEFTVPPGKPEFAAPDVEIAPTLLSALMGKPLPEWHIADAIGTPKDTKLASFRGKYALLLFWRHGCPSCRGWGIPNLVKFVDRHADWKPRLQVVAFHNRDAKDAAELQALLAKEQGLGWNVLALPFPIVIDSAAQSTVDEWGPGEFPYAVLVDPEGKLAGKGSLEEMEKQLKEALK